MEITEDIVDESHIRQVIIIIQQDGRIEPTNICECQIPKLFNYKSLTKETCTQLENFNHFIIVYYLEEGGPYENKIATILLGKSIKGPIVLVERDVDLSPQMIKEWITTLNRQ